MSASDLAAVDDAPKATSSWMAIVVPALAGLIGAFGGGYLSFLSSTRTAEDDYKVKMAASISTAIPYLTDRNRAALAYAGLYALAHNKDDKLVLVTIAATTGSPSVQDVLAVFAGSDPETHDIFLNNKELKTLIIASNQASSQASASAALRKTPTTSETQRIALTSAAAAVPDEGRVALLSTVAKPKAGWLYFGRLGTPGKGECVDPSTPLPALNQPITLCGARYVRDLPPGSPQFGHILGALPAGATVTVRKRHEIPLGSDARAVWIEADIPASVFSEISPKVP